MSKSPVTIIVATFPSDGAASAALDPVSYTHLTLPTSDLV